MPRKGSNGLDSPNSTQPITPPSPPPPISGQRVTLEPITPQAIPSLFTHLGFPQTNHLVDHITGFPYVSTAEALSTHIFSYLDLNPDLTIFAIKACPNHLGPPSSPLSLPDADTHADTSVLGLIGYRLHPPSHTIALDDVLFSPALQRTYASTEASYLLLRHLFESSQTPSSYARVWVRCSTANVASRRHLERLGYVHEGVLRKDNVTRWGTARDSHCLSMLDSEWVRNKRVLEGWLGGENFDAQGRQVRSMGEVRDAVAADKDKEGGL
ncbi:hypothetical protein BKA58DRAFT_443997 [Alternaria rosae]|uniref:uncharacterized protein n=1 Tax=Alternaria rosae TaxID=1187941 RepID=UPI001E8DB923|nr:uncharacterized protein BKA58DRAFT_443997 [Alternaria rosae]KAH6858813.1 hypothetical protein BKA58DRAFT_443997 [Alternaria rosae]